MANMQLFRSLIGALVPATSTVNTEPAPAYAFGPQHTLAQYAATGCLHTTFYVSAEAQLRTVLELCQQVEPEFIARTALYCHQRGFMKARPALLCAVLAVRDTALLGRVFPQVIDNARMLRIFVQIIRSGVVGRKAFGTAVRRLLRDWLAQRDDDNVFHSAVGAQPSLADIIKRLHPQPQTASREALYGYLLGRADNAEAIPALVRQYEAFKGGPRDTVPAVPFQMLTALDLGRAEWTAIAHESQHLCAPRGVHTARHERADCRASTGSASDSAGAGLAVPTAGGPCSGGCCGAPGGA